jgi:type IV pilus assembly protein PilQ
MKVPIMGWLFKAQLKQEQLQELLIFITPRIVQLEQRHAIQSLSTSTAAPSAP